MAHGVTVTGKATLHGTIRPAARPRYNGNDQHDAIVAAARMSLHYGRPFYVYRAYGIGYGITYENNLPYGTSHAHVDGCCVTFYGPA